MSNDLTQTQHQGDEGWQRARDASLRLRKAPTQVPGYEVEKCLGEGAFGEVWLATDRNNPGRKVAIKFYTRRGGDWALLAREVEKLNYLATDRYVVQLLDVGWNSDPPYYVMEYMESGSLADRLQHGPLAAKEALEMFRDIATGVVNAHNRGVLHCDLKPANVLLGLDGKPRFADFGQSRLSHEQAPALGTLFYMAPEQADLKAVPDTRWDVYALGAVLTCMLTGAPPYRNAPGATELEQPGSLDERLARYRKLLQQASRSHPIHRIRGVDRALSDIITRCLAVNPAKRYANVQAVLNALDTRTLRHARRPLLILGAVGPLLLLMLMALVIRSQLGDAVNMATETLTEETKDANKFAAQAVAAKVGAKLERRWRALEVEAARGGLKKLLKAAHEHELGMKARRVRNVLQFRLDKMCEDNHETDPNSWVVFAADGKMLARSPQRKDADSNIGKPFWHKTFFNGLEYDLDPAKDRPAPPIKEFHHSKVLVSNFSKNRMVIFSVPVLDDKNAAGQDILGVLIRTVDVGNFAELTPEDGAGQDFLAALVDTREDADKKRGAILEHPAMIKLKEAKVPQRDWKYYVEAQPLFLNTGAEARWDPDYRDPLGQKFPEYNAHWLAASYPVMIEDRPLPGNSYDTGWMVVVQKRYDKAIGPVKQLESDMLQRGWWALGIALTLVTGLWAFVILVLNDGGRSRLLGFLRRRAGLKSDSLARSLKPSLSARSSESQSAKAGVPTVTGPPVSDQGPAGPPR